MLICMFLHNATRVISPILFLPMASLRWRYRLQVARLKSSCFVSLWCQIPLMASVIQHTVDTGKKNDTHLSAGNFYFPTLICAT